MSNPNGVGGFQPGHPPLSNGRPRSESAIRLLFLRDCRDAHATIVAIMHNAKGTKAEALRLQAADMILNRGLGKPNQGISMDFNLNKPLEVMNVEELQSFRARYAAVMTASPPLLDQVIAEEERAEPELPLGDANGGDGDDAGDAAADGDVGVGDGEPRRAGIRRGVCL
jgi:hypothetical protein